MSNNVETVATNLEDALQRVELLRYLLHSLKDSCEKNSVEMKYGTPSGATITTSSYGAALDAVYTIEAIKDLLLDESKKSA